MVAVITGNGTGLERSSAFVLGSRGQLGQSALGRANDNVFVNGATGGLTVQNLDEMLIGLGPNIGIARTYNSLGNLSDDNGDNWRASVSRKVAGLTGTINTAGSTITRTDWDGSETVYSWDTTKSAYVSKEGSGAYDTLTFAGSTWTWKDGNSRVTELYDNNNNGRITSSADTDGNALTFTYNGSGLVSRVTTADGHYTDLTYTGTNLTQITTSYRDTAGGTLKTLTRVRYGYDGSNRLSTVTVDLTPNDNSVTDNVKYVTTYTYDGTSKRVASITQTDGSSLAIAYTLVGADYRVSSLTQTAASGVTRLTSFSYNTGTRTTTITDPSSQVTTLTYDTSGNLLTMVAPPAVSGGTAQTSTFTYNANGDVLTTVDPSGRTITYDYDANGNAISQRDTAGNTVTSTFGSNNELLTQTQYLVPDPDGAGAQQPTVPVTTRYAYDAENHLRFVVSAEGYVTEFVFNAAGQQTSAIQYAGNTYNITGLAANVSIAESTLASWASGLDKSTAKRTDTTYNFRGDVATVTSFGKTLASGAGDTTATTEITKLNYVYDQAGNLLSRQLDGAGGSETYVYDGLNRITSTVDSRGLSTTLTTTVTFNDASSITTVVTSGSGGPTITQTSTYNLAGELITFAKSASGVTTQTSTYRYDAMGRLRGVTDALGVKTYFLYDRVGRKVADIQADGQITEYGYNADNLLIKTVRYKTLVSSTLLTQLDSNVANFTYELSAYRPSSDAADIWEWRVYDSSQRLIETIDGAGAATVFEYDGASRLVKTTAYANLIASGTVTGYKTAAPTSLALPTADSANDRVSRLFYDDDGRLEYTFDAAGYLTRSIYDSAGQLVETIAYADVGDLAASTLSAIVSSVTVDNAKDIHGWSVYDQRGLLRAAIDGEGNLVRYHYTALGFVDQVIVGQKLSSTELAAIITTRPTLATLPAAAGGTVLETTAYTRDLHGKVLTQTRTLAGGATETDTYTYDTYGRLLKLVTLSGAADTRTATWRYDNFGRLTGQLSGEGSAALAALGASPTQVQIDDIYARWGTQYAYDQDDRLISTVESNGTDAAGRKTLYYYDVDGQLTHTINALGEAIEYRYDAFGRRTDVVVYGTRISAGTLATLTGGLVNTTLTNAITAITNASVDSRTQLAYNVTGTVSSSTDAEAAATTYSYNAFGELTAQLDPISAGVTRQVSRAYDRKGLLLSTTVDAAGLNIISSATYDAFGRAITTTDADGKVRATGYDRAGRVLTTTDPLSGVTTYTYDGRGAVLTVKDRVNATAVTSFAYTAFNRTVTMTTPEGLVTTTTNNAYGQTLTVTDGASRTVTFTYDKDGALKTETNGLNNQSQNTYDKAGRLSFTLDERGYKTSFTYDAASRVLTRKVDDGGLNLITTYEYDAKGQQTKVTDAAGRISTIAFDRNGRTTTVTANPAGLAIVTKYEYDQIGRSTKVTEAFGSSAARVTQYNYDKADRLTSTQVNPTGLNLTTTYAYDKRGNVIARTDASGAKTRFVYDADNRLTWTVDAVGSVTKTSYDNEGRVITTLGYANMVPSATLTSWGTTPLTETMVTTAVSTSASDHKISYVYDKDGRQTHTVQANGAVTAFTYDGSGNVIQTTQYNALYTAGGTPDLAAMNTWISANASAANDRTSRTVYDAAGRAVFQLRPERFVAGPPQTQYDDVTQVKYDAAGNAISVIQYAASYTTSGAPSALDMANWVTTNASAANDRTSRTVYDGAGRAVYSVDAESYVGEVQYDAAGNVLKEIRYAATYAVTDGVTAASLASLIGALPGTAAVTQYAYDAAGRLTDITDALGSVTHLEMDALGQVVYRTVAYGTADAAMDYRLFDAAGRVILEARGFGSAEQSNSEYSYDGLGRVLVATSGRGFLTTYTYDGAGQVLTETVQLATSVTAVTTNQYDAFGNLVKVTDARGNAGYFYYDALSQLTRQVDPENYVTDTTYSLGGEAISVKRFYNKATTGLGSVTTPPTTPTAHAKDATTTIVRDKLDRVTSTTDAEGFAESYTLNAFGDRITVVGKVGGSTTNTYDKRGLLLTEVLPISSTLASGTVQATTVTNKYEYDARGNRTKATEAFGLAEARVTNFTYDKLNRLITEAVDQVQVLASNLVTTSNVTPTQTIAYDRRGNIIESIDAAGARTLYYYDDINRKTAQVSAAGTLSVWAYDGTDNAVSMKVYGDVVTLPGSAGGTAPAPVNGSNFRETTYAYDRNNRLISTSVASLRTGAWNGTSFATSVVTVTTQLVYDAMGNVVQETDGAGANIFHFYDKRGRELARVDQENYLTFNTLDAEGNVTKEERFSTKLSATVTTASVPTALRPTAVAADRVTDFTYDRVGQRLTETRTGVVSYAISDSTGLLSAGSTSATITYAYNGLGEVTRKTEANGDYTDYTYDSGGRQLTATNSAFTDYAGISVQHRVDTFYNGLNDVTRTREGKVATDSGIDRITTFTYGAGGRLASTTDATGAVRTYAYDAVGHVVKEGYTRLKADGTTTLTEANAYQYDALGRATLQATASWNGSAWTFGDKTHIRYGVYGEVTGKGITAGSVSTPVYQETFEYDGGGRMWRSNTGDGSYRLYMYDAAGRATLAVSSTTTDLSGYASIEAAITALGSTNITGGAYLAGIAPTITVYDKRGQATATRENYRQLTASGTSNLVRSKTYNAFGEVTSETDARGYATSFSYNSLGKLIQKMSPQVSVTAENGGVSNTNPTENYYYDISGRLIGVEDANSNLNTRALLAGSGHGQEEAIVTKEFRAGGNSILDNQRSGTFATGYDVFGDARKLTNELGHIELRDYDKAGRLITLTRPTRVDTYAPTSTTTTLVEHYGYDSLGQRTTHWNSQLLDYQSNPAKERTDYDSQGRIVRTEGFGDGITSGLVTTYGYAWNAALATTGLATYGGWVKTTTEANGYSRTDSQDYFGHLVARSDLGGHTYSLAYDKGGRMVGQSSSTGQNLTYTYYNTGRMASVADGVTGYYSLTTATYDADANRLTETHAVMYNGTPSATYQNATVTYDALNRMVSYADTGTYGGAMANDYKYDAVGNVRRLTTSSNSVVAQDNWYRYDSMNRFVTAKGVFTGTAGSGSISRGFAGGMDITYDAAGQRTSVTTSTHYQDELVGTVATSYNEWEQQWYYDYYYATYDLDTTEYYVYGEDGFLIKVDHDDEYFVFDSSVSNNGTVVTDGVRLRATDTRDAMGRVLSHIEHGPNGAWGVYQRYTTYDNRSLVTTDYTIQLQNDGKTLHSTTTYDYKAESSPGSGVYTGAFLGGVVTHQQTTSYTLNPGGGGQTNKPTTDTKTSFVWWDSAKQNVVTYKPNINQGTTYTSTFSYDAVGRVSSVYIADGRPRTAYFEVNMGGQIIHRWETSAASTNPDAYYAYFNGLKVGDRGNNGTTDTDYATAIANRFITPGYGPFQFGGSNPTNYLDYDQSFDPINPGSTGAVATSYTVSDGDTLQSIAQAVWGNAALWYMIADANGLSSADSLAGGMSLVIPNRVTNINNNSSTFRVYDPNKVIGDTNPTQPKPPPKPKQGCGVLGAIIMAAVAIAVVVITKRLDLAAKMIAAFEAVGAPTAVATVAAGATIGAASSIISQGVGLAIGAIDEFSWNSVALAAIAGGVGGAGGTDGFFGNVENAFVRGALNSVASNIITQSVTVATGLQDKFDWTGVAVAGVMGGVTELVSQRLAFADAKRSILEGSPGAQPDKYEIGARMETRALAETTWSLAGVGNQAVSGMASALAGAATRSLIEGTDFGDNLVALLPDVIGNTIGNMIAGGLATASSGPSDGETPHESLFGQGLRKITDMLGDAIHAVGDTLGLDGQFGYQGGDDRALSLAGFGHALGDAASDTVHAIGDTLGFDGRFGYQGPEERSLSLAGLRDAVEGVIAPPAAAMTAPAIAGYGGYVSDALYRLDIDGPVGPTLIQANGSQSGPRLTRDGDVRYYTFDGGVELFPIVRLGNESFTDTAARALGELDLDVVVNGALYGFTDGGSYPLISPLMPIDPDSTLTQGLVVGGGVQLAGRRAPDMAYFAKIVQADGSIGYRFGTGDPTIVNSIAAFGGAIPLIIDGLPYGEVNLYSGPSTGAPRTGSPGSFGGSLTQRSNATFSSFVSRYEGGGNFSTGKVIVAYNSKSGAFTVVVQPDGASSGRSLAAIRDRFIRQGYDNAVAFDGSSSATLVTPRGTIISPAPYKNNTIGTGIGFRMPRVAPRPVMATKPNGT